MKVEERIEKTEKRIKYLEVELIHRAYHDGWTIRGFEKELVILKDRLRRLNDRKK